MGRSPGDPLRLRRKWSRPSLSEEVHGLMDAFKFVTGSDVSGSERTPLERWTSGKQSILENALRSWGRSAEDARALAELLVEEAFLASLSGRAIRHEIPWMSGTISHLWQGLCRARQRLKARGQRAESQWANLSDPAPTPLESAESSDQVRFEKGRISAVARELPKPYGHVLVWRLKFGLLCQDIRVRLNGLRLARLAPIGNRQVQMYTTEAVRMFRERLRGINPRESHVQRYMAKKNPWIDSPMPPLETLIP
jgi:DNA-directed RNA polymerase specialized sigma24 family protein